MKPPLLPNCTETQPPHPDSACVLEAENRRQAFSDCEKDTQQFSAGRAVAQSGRAMHETEGELT